MTLFRKITLVLILGTFLTWVGWDIILVLNNEETISRDLLGYSKHNTWLPYLMGFLSGHWFFPRKRVFQRAWIVALVILGALAIWDSIHNYLQLPVVIYRFSGLWFLIGILAGSYLWGQPDGDSPL